MDRVLFRAPFVLVAADNSSPQRVDSLDEARAAVRRGEAASVAGTLRAGVLAADVDPADAEVDPVLGDAVAEHLVAWCVARGIPYLVRESGRAGGRHVLAVTGSRAVACEWAQVCAEAGRRHGVPVMVRTGMALRLLSAPHRLGLQAPVVGGTLTPAAVLDVVEDQAAAHRAAVRRRLRPVPVRRRPGGRDTSRSGREFGQACAMVRAGYTAAQAWAVQNRPGSKAAERGELGWRRYVWLPAVVTVAAEEGVEEAEAWQRSQVACRSRCRMLGREGWRVRLWRPAQRDAERDRPRRYRVEDTAPWGSTSAQRAEIEAVRRGLLAVAEERLTAAGVRPQRRHSAAALLHALVPALVQRDGSISVRDLALAARLDPKTVRAARDTLVEAEVITLPHRYQGGTDDCDRYALGPASQESVAAARTTAETSPTSCSTPPPPGGASPRRLTREAQEARQLWRLRLTLSAATEATGETYAESQHPAAKTLRSLHYQRQWWRSRTPQQQKQRRAIRRRVLDKLSTVDLSAWLEWLARRELIANAADRIRAGTATTVDHETATNAPRTIHRGMRDPLWRTGGTPSGEPGEQLQLLVA
ncbi:hypothetical protein [Longimycelium tulufanense]|uniref:hypothetical protein n=1 Tax=Longimycelium tulufanense TaxID=907463 RepID=UPI00166F1FDC|nr:hypothetical protein [Longimycelium tulufanense]